MFGITGSNLAETVGVDPGSAQRKGFTREFNVGDFDTFGGDVTAGKFTEIARFEVPADTEYSFGSGSAKHEANQGFVYVDLQDGVPAAVEGILRFKVESSTGRKSEVVKDLDTDRLDASKTDRTLMVPLPEQVGSSLATENAYLVLELDPDADGTVASANCDVIVPVTEYDLS